MTDPRNYENFEYVRRGEALGGASLWTLGIGIAVVIALLVIVSYFNPAAEIRDIILRAVTYRMAALFHWT